MSDRVEQQETDNLEKISEVATLMIPPSTKIDEDAAEHNLSINKISFEGGSTNPIGLII